MTFLVPILAGVLTLAGISSVLAEPWLEAAMDLCRGKTPKVGDISTAVLQDGWRAAIVDSADSAKILSVAAFNNALNEFQIRSDQTPVEREAVFAEYLDTAQNHAEQIVPGISFFHGDTLLWLDTEPDYVNGDFAADGTSPRETHIVRFCIFTGIGAVEVGARKYGLPVYPGPSDPPALTIGFTHLPTQPPQNIPYMVSNIWPDRGAFAATDLPLLTVIPGGL